MPQRPDRASAGDEEKQEGTDPEHQGLALESGTIAYKVAVAGDHVIEDLLLALTLLQFLADLFAKILRQIGLGGCDGFVLTYETAELLRHRHDAGL